MITVDVQEFDEHVLIRWVAFLVIVVCSVVAILPHTKLIFLARGQAASQLIDLKRA